MSNRNESIMSNRNESIMSNIGMSLFYQYNYWKHYVETIGIVLYCFIVRGLIALSVTERFHYGLQLSYSSQYSRGTTTSSQ